MLENIVPFCYIFAELWRQNPAIFDSPSADLMLIRKQAQAAKEQKKKEIIQIMICF